MTCKVIKNSKNETVAIVCSSPWGIGTYNFVWEDGEEESIYGFPTQNTDPHDFSPDEECCTEKEIENWKLAKVNCNCGR